MQVCHNKSLHRGPKLRGTICGSLRSLYHKLRHTVWASELGVMSGRHMQSFELEKSIWSDADFDVMGWHDARIYAFAFIPEEYEFRLDVDYIFKWVDPAEGHQYFSFWVSPVTLCFENSSDIKIDVHIGSYYELEILDVRRTLLGKTPNGKFDSWLFEIETNNGIISLNATGYKQYVRMPPMHSESQALTLAQRGGVVLEKT